MIQITNTPTRKVTIDVAGPINKITRETMRKFDILEESYMTKEQIEKRNAERAAMMSKDVNAISQQMVTLGKSFERAAGKMAESALVFIEQFSAAIAKGQAVTKEEALKRIKNEQVLLKMVNVTEKN